MLMMLVPKRFNSLWTTGTMNVPIWSTHLLDTSKGLPLISANDAVFSEEDWEGIQNLQQSIKADDPFKVGRFGIGFNSVYHLTGTVCLFLFSSIFHE